MKKNFRTLLFCVLCTVLSVTAQDSWKKIKLPEGKNLFSNPALQVHSKIKGSIEGWGNYGGKRLAVSWIDTQDGKILRVTSKEKGYHFGIARSYKLKPGTEYTFFAVCRGKITGPDSKLVMLYRHASLPNWKKAAVSGTSGTMKKDFPWTLFTGTIRTPDHTGMISTSFYLTLTYGQVELDIACAGLVEKGPAAAVLKPLDPKFKNLLNNPTFKNGRNNLPYDWNLEFAEKSQVFRSQNGVVTLLPPVKRNALFKVKNDNAVVLRQGELILQPGKKYRLSAWINTKNFTAARSGVIVYNYAWVQSVGFEGLPENTNSWKKIEKDIILPKSKWDSYCFAVYTVDHKDGLFQVKDVGLYPAEDAAAVRISKAPAHDRLYRITPVHPLLSAMDPASGKMTFSFDYVLPGKETDYECRVSFTSKGAKPFTVSKTYPLANRKIFASLGKLPVGEGILRAVMVEKKTGKVLGKEEYSAVVKAPFKGAKKVEKRLNMLSQRLLTAKTDSQGKGSYIFTAPRRTWVWIRIDSAPGKNSVVKLNGDTLKGHPYPNAWETLRLLPEGDYKLEISGASARTALKVNAVPEIFVYSYPWIPGKISYPTFRKPFYNKYVFPVITTVNHGFMTAPAVRKEYASYGKTWFTLGLHLHKLNKFEDPVKMAHRLNPDRREAIQGMAFDEIFIASITDKWIFTQALRELVKSRYPMYTWSSGVKFMINGLNADYFSATANNARGTGKFLFECYARTQPDEKAAEAYLDDFVNETIRRAAILMPGAPQYSHIVLGGYSRPGVYCTDTFAGPDVKKFWDMFFHRLANDREFKDLYGVGLYCYHHGTEESIRWWNALIRHYCFEGNRDSLAARYGYKYIPGHIRNGDFDHKLSGWKAVPAEKDSVKTDKIPRFGLTYQRRQGYPNTTGENFCVFKRSTGKANLLSTELTGLKKGQLYVLRYTLADRADVKAKKASGRKLGLFVSFKGAVDVTASSAVAKYTAPDGVFVQNYVNNCSRVFRAESDKATVTFSDWKDGRMAGPAGQEILMNLVRVTPYFAEK